MEIIIKPVPGYEQFYSASSDGRVFSHNYRMTGRFEELAQSSLYDKRRTSSTLYRRAKMWHINRHTPTALHRVIALTFIPNPNNYPCVNHLDGDKGNNNAENLEWCTVKHNNRHSEATGLSRHQQGEDHGMHILTEKQVLEIKERLSNNWYWGIGVELGREYGVSHFTISDIKQGKSWKHLGVKNA